MEYFRSVISSFFFFFSSPILSRHILDVYHTQRAPPIFGLNIPPRCSARGSLKMQDAKIAKNAPSAYHRTTLSSYFFATKAHIDNRENVLNNNMSSTCSHNMVNCGPLAAETDLPLWGTQQISTGFASWLRYCSDVAHRRPTKFCTMFGRLMGFYTTYTFSDANFTVFKSCVLLYWQRYCTALQQRASAKLCGMVKEWNYGTFAEGAIYIRVGSHHVVHRPTL